MVGILVGGCLKRVTGLVLLVLLLGIAFFYRGAISGLWDRLRGREAEASRQPSAEMADAAQAKLESLGEDHERVALSEPEVQSLLEYRLRSFLPAYVMAPTVGIQDSRLQLSARVPTERLPRLDELGGVAQLLPDTTEITATGQIIPIDSGQVALAVDDLRAAKIPVPRRLIPAMVRRLGRGGPRVPEDAIMVPLPPGAASAYLRGDSLIFIARPARSGRGE